jgi:hypothetical protein
MNNDERHAEMIHGPPGRDYEREDQGMTPRVMIVYYYDLDTSTCSEN